MNSLAHIPRLFLDTNIILDFIIPSRKGRFACSVELIENIKNGNFEAWTGEYALSETLGQLKAEKEVRMGTQQLPRETVSRFDISQMVAIIENVKKIPHLTIFVSPSITQSDIFNQVQTTCVQATDAMVLLSVLELVKKIQKVTLVTRDERLGVRGSKLVATAHPVNFLAHCPRTCLSLSVCKYRKP